MSILKLFLNNFILFSGWIILLIFLFIQYHSFVLHLTNNNEKPSRFSQQMKHVPGNITITKSVKKNIPRIINNEKNEFQVFNKQKILNSNYSSHLCIGGHNYHNGAFQRKCVFHNLCHFENEGDVLHYYIDPTLPSQPIISENNQYYYDFSQSFVKLGVYDNTDAFSPIVEYSMKPNFTYDSAEQSILHQSLYEQNAGHFIELLFTTYALPKMLGYSNNRNIRLLDYHLTVPNKKFRKSLLGLISNYQSEYLASMGNVCFKEVFMGSGQLSVLEATDVISVIFRSFRDFMITNLKESFAKSNVTSITHNNFTISIDLYPKIKKHRIIILQKSTLIKPHLDSETDGSLNNYNHIKNHNELVTYLTQTFNGYVDVINILPEDYTWEQQILLIRTATIIIAPPGTYVRVIICYLNRCANSQFLNEING